MSVICWAVCLHCVCVCVCFVKWFACLCYAGCVWCILYMCVCVCACVCMCVCCSRAAPGFMVAAWVGLVAGGELSFVYVMFESMSRLGLCV